VTLRNPGLRSFVLPAAVLAIVILGTLGYVALSRPAETAPPGLPPSPVEGVVVRIDSPSLGKVNEIDVLMRNGKTVSLGMGALENATQFSPSHLQLHMATGVPILAYYRLEAGRPLIYRLEDAAASPSPAT
jgi:hypothetical protein